MRSCWSWFYLVSHGVTGLKRSLLNLATNAKVCWSKTLNSKLLSGGLRLHPAAVTVKRGKWMLSLVWINEGKNVKPTDCNICLVFQLCGCLWREHQNHPDVLCFHHLCVESLCLAAEIPTALCEAVVVSLCNWLQMWKPRWHANSSQPLLNCVTSPHSITSYLPLLFLSFCSSSTRLIIWTRLQTHTHAGAEIHACTHGNAPHGIKGTRHDRSHVDKMWTFVFLNLAQIWSWICFRADVALWTWPLLDWSVSASLINQTQLQRRKSSAAS